ncbi:MAG: hypothetical protein ACRD0Z_04725 [Acidimicrobiales bacterium]
MSGVVESMPALARNLFEEVIGERNPLLLETLRTTDQASPAQRLAVEEILSAEFSRELRQDFEPTDRGRAIDDLLGQFLLRWPIQGAWKRRAIEGHELPPSAD